jgi:uncharacterized protein (TIGR02145 family)
MKTSILLAVLMIAMIMGAFAQKPSMTLTFTADNNGQYVPLNSILIENLTQGGDTTLYAPDTVLMLDYGTGFGDYYNSPYNEFSVSQNHPNPMQGKTTISLYLPENEKVLITISDIIGRKLIHTEYPLNRGGHSFTFFPGTENMYFFTVRISQQSRTIKMFNSPGTASTLGICKLEYYGRQTGMNSYKTGNALNNFVFNLGDQLQYTASSALGNLTIIDSPSVNQTYTFLFGSGGMPCPDMPTVTDIDGNLYNTVLIGNQCWMKENLKTATYRNGTSIPNITDSTEWSNMTTDAYVWYNNDISWKDKYGALYNWFAIINPGGLCPTGWHVPTDDEWTTLTDYIGGTGEPHGNELKSCRQVNSPLGGGCNTNEHPRWKEDINNGNYGTDDYGFSGLPGGFRDGSGPFYDVGYSGGWCSSTEYSSGGAWGRYLSFLYGGVYVNYYDEQFGFSVRCLRD